MTAPPRARILACIALLAVALPLAGCSGSNEQAAPATTDPTALTAQPTPDDFDEEAAKKAIANRYEEYLQALVKGSTLDSTQQEAYLLPWVTSEFNSNRKTFFADMRQERVYLKTAPTASKYDWKTITPEFADVFICQSPWDYRNNSDNKQPDWVLKSQIGQNMFLEKNDSNEWIITGGAMGPSVTERACS